MKKDSNLQKRIPIVSILGHVDHGKTTILDKIRSTDVQSGEVGGITQKISAFTVNVAQDKKLTFIDTPGHEAFNLMRLRGGSIADIVLLIVAADDGVKPQTIESIGVINNSSAKPIVVINKVDLPNINLEKVKRELSTHGMQVEGMGGSVPVVEVSGKTGKGIDTLLETIWTVAEIEGLNEYAQLPVNALGRGYVLESVKDKSKGFLATIVNVQGEFNRADWLCYKQKGSINIEKIKGFVSEENQNIEKLEAGFGGRILGLSGAVELGTEIYTIKDNDKKIIKELFQDVAAVEAAAEAKVEAEMTDEAKTAGLLAELFASTEEVEQEKKKLNVILKSSSEGSLEAILKSLEKIDVEGHKVNIIEAAIGDVTSRDVDRASVTKSILLAFEVNINSDAQSLAAEKRVLVRQYNIIYKIVEEVSDALTLMATPRETEEDLGEAEIRQIFVLSNGNKVLGGRVKTGIIKRKEKCYIVRNDEIVGEGRIIELKHNKNEINEAGKGSDFGAIIEPTPDAQEGDEIHCFKVVKVTF